MKKELKRVKSDRAIEIKTWKDADSYIQKIGSAQGSIRSQEEASKQTVDKIKKVLADKVKLLNKQIKHYHKSLEQFAQSHEKEFGKKRSRSLVYGAIGWRRSISTSVGKKTLELIKKVFKTKARKYITVKESVNKSALAELSKKDLTKIGAERKDKDTFFVEPSQSKAVEY